MKKNHPYFILNLNDEEQASLIKDIKNNKFLISIKKVVRFLSINEQNPFANVMSQNIRNMTAEIEINLDDFLEDLKIPFRTEDFLLILFQELYEQFVYNAKTRSK